MERNEKGQEFDLQEFLKPSCPLKVGDRFYKNYRVPNTLIIWEVQKVDDVEDEKGPFYAVTAKSNNITIGNNVRVFSSRYLATEEYTIMKRGVDF